MNDTLPDKYDVSLGCSHANNLTPQRAFHLVNKRINWLNDRIIFNRANRLPYWYFIEEREGLIWLLDKVGELSKKLLEFVEKEKLKED